MSWINNFLTEEGKWKMDEKAGKELMKKLKLASPSIYDELIVEQCKRLNEVKHSSETDQKHTKIKKVVDSYKGGHADAINSVINVVNGEVENIDNTGLKPNDNGYDDSKPALKPIDNISKPTRRGGQWGGFACTDDSIKQLNSGIDMVNSEVNKFKHITSDYDHGSVVSDSEYEALCEKIGEESTKIINGRTSEDKKLVHELIDSERKAAHEFIENLGESKEECIEAAKQRDIELERGDKLAKTQAIVHASYEKYYDNCNKNEERNKELAEQCIFDAGDWKNSSLVLKYIDDTVAEHANIVLDVLSDYAGILNYANALDLIQEKAEDIIYDLPEETQKIIKDVCCASRGFAIRLVGYCIDKGEAFLHRGLLTSKSGYFRLARIFCELVASKMCENFFGTSLKRK